MEQKEVEMVEQVVIGKYGYGVAADGTNHIWKVNEVKRSKPWQSSLTL